MKYGGLNRLSLCSITESGSGSTWQPLTERREGRIKGRMIKKREWERQEREVEEFSIIPWFKMVTQKKVVRKEKEKMVCNLNWILNLTILSLLFPYLFLAFLKKSDFRLWWDEWMERERLEKLSCVIIHFQGREGNHLKRFRTNITEREKSDHIKYHHFTFSRLLICSSSS